MRDGARAAPPPPPDRKYRASYGMMLLMCGLEMTGCAREIVPIHSKCSRGGKWQMTIAGERYYDRVIAAFIKQQVVEVDIVSIKTFNRLSCKIIASEKSITFSKAVPKFPRECRPNRSRRDSSYCQPFQHAPHLNGIFDLLRRCPTCRIAASSQPHDQPLLLERAECGSHRHARDTEALGGSDFGNAHAIGNLSRDDHLAQGKQYALTGLHAGNHHPVISPHTAADKSSLGLHTARQHLIESNSQNTAERTDGQRT